MLKRVQIQNFRCLRNVSVPLRPLTVLIGPNDSGKSVFLLALKQLVEAQLPTQASHREPEVVR